MSTRLRSYPLAALALAGLSLSAAVVRPAVAQDATRFAAQGLTFDRDADGRKDMAIWHPGTGTWEVLTQNGDYVEQQWGAPGDIPMRGDYDGDGRSDFVVFRPSNGTWYGINTSDGATWSLAYGASTDVPVSGDYNGDRRTDVALFRPSTGTWYYTTNRLNSFARPSCGAGDVPVVAGDMEGTGRSSFLTWRPSTGRWCQTPLLGGPRWLTTATAGDLTMGRPGDIPLGGDFQYLGAPNSGTTHLSEPVIWRPSTRTFSTGELLYCGYCIPGGQNVWNIASWIANLPGFSKPDMVKPISGDWDGDGRLDFILYDTTVPGQATLYAWPTRTQGGNLQAPVRYYWIGGTTGDLAL